MLNFVYKGIPKKAAKVITEKYSEISYSNVQKLIRNKQIMINGKRISSDTLLNYDDSVAIFYNSEFRPKIIYEDENILIAYKPKGMLSEEEFLVKLREYKKDNGINLCHRLDRNTDGLLTFAKNEAAFNEILKAFKMKRVKKVYHALLYGRLEENHKICTAYLLKNPEISKVKIYDKAVKGSYKIETEYNVIGYSGKNTLAEIIIHTGKTHQIRAYFAYIGHFVLGDGKYGNDTINRKEGFKKQQLTASEISFNFDDDSKLYYLNERIFKLK